jgi:site-specific recombinase XerD
MSALAPTLQAFFTERLIRQRHASSQTVAAYRDSLRLFVDFASSQVRKQPCHLDIADLDAAMVARFLDHLERERGNSVRTRNARLSAIHSLFHFAALRHPEQAEVIQRVLAIPPKRFDRALISFLNGAEVDALLASPDRSTWTGRRDHALLLLAVQTGLRASELTGLRCGDVHLGTGPHIGCRGKGRKDRITPLTVSAVAVLRVWLKERGVMPDGPLFPARDGGRLSRDALEDRIAKYVEVASPRCPTLRTKRVSAHTLRHTAAMQLLRAGIDTSVIALWLGHEQVDTTQIYLHADLSIKERALARTKPPSTKPGRFRPSDSLLAFLETL